MSHNNFKMPFGKLQGVALEDCPVEYLDWLIGADFMQQKPDLLEKVTEHLKGRQDWQQLENEGDWDDN